MAATVYELRGRAEKVLKLVKTLDAHLSGAGVHPFSEQAAVAVADLSLEAWSRAAQIAGCNMPSETTRMQVVLLYQGRPAHVADVKRRAGL
jgi:hypothetical protein